MSRSWDFMSFLDRCAPTDSEADHEVAAALVAEYPSAPPVMPMASEPEWSMTAGELDFWFDMEADKDLDLESLEVGRAGRRNGAGDLLMLTVRFWLRWLLMVVGPLDLAEAGGLADVAKALLDLDSDACFAPESAGELLSCGCLK